MNDHLFCCNVLLASVNFQGTLELERILIHLRKIFNYLSKCCCQIAFSLFRMNFEYSCDQITFRMVLSKKLPLKWRKLLSPKYPSVGSKQKRKMNTRNTMVSLYHQKVKSTQKMEVPFFLCLGYIPIFRQKHRFYIS